MEKIFNATDESLHEVLAYVEEQLDLHECGMKQSMTIAIAVEEIFVNIAHYAYGEGSGLATIGMDFEDDDVIITFIDEGFAFDPLAKEDPDITASAEERDIGGLGIYMVKKSMDECTYNRIDNKNIFTIRKKIK